MVKINVLLEKGPRADLRRRYNRYRERFLRGDTKTGWFPKFRYYEFEKFDDLVSDGASILECAAKESVEEVELTELESLEIRLKRCAHIGYTTLGDCRLQPSIQDADISLSSYLVFEQFYRAFSEERYSNENSKMAKRRLKKTLNHELRHHLDLVFRVYCRSLFDTINKIFPDTWHDDRRLPWQRTADVKNYWFKYVITNRVEGFAEFWGELNYIPDMQDMENVLKALKGNSQLRANGFLKNLQKETETVKKVIDYFEGKHTVSREDIIDNVEAGHYGFATENPLKLPVIFSPYTQGDYMFQIIALAELQRRSESDGTFKGFESLFRRDFVPIEVQREVSKQILQQKRLFEFYELFYRSVNMLRLAEKYTIIPRDSVEKFFPIEMSLPT